MNEAWRKFFDRNDWRVILAITIVLLIIELLNTSAYLVNQRVTWLGWIMFVFICLAAAYVYAYLCYCALYWLGMFLIQIKSWFYRENKSKFKSIY